MRTNLPISLLLGLFLSLWPIGSMGRIAVADQQLQRITVELSSGRSLSGFVDSQTDANRLWLRWGQGLMVVLRPIHWEKVVCVQADGESFSAGDFLRTVNGGRKTLPGSTDEPVVLRLPAERFATPSNATSDRLPQDTAATSMVGARAAVERVGSARKVRSLVIDARVANWDGDVEVDGLIVHVYPTDAEGRPVPVSGTLEVNLIGTGGGSGIPANRLARWTRRVRDTDFNSGRVSYRLPFQSIHPEFDPQWSSYGVVHCRLSVPGVGVFERTESSLRLRPYSAFRDGLQLGTGRRFLSLEKTGRGK